MTTFGNSLVSDHSNVWDHLRLSVRLSDVLLKLLPAKDRQQVLEQHNDNLCSLMSHNNYRVYSAAGSGYAAAHIF